MAVYFLLKVECGLSRDAAEAVTNHFDNLNLSLPDGQTTICRSSTMLDEESNWQSVTQPKGASIGGFFTEVRSDGSEHHERDGGLNCNADTLTEIAHALLNHLRTAPPYRYGIVGHETADIYYASDLSEENWENTDGFGVVLSEGIWRSIGSPANFAPFEIGYVWRPFVKNGFNVCG